MAVTNELAERIRARLGGDPNVGEIRMFGGICFTLNRNMLVGTMKDGTLLARVGEEQEEAALAKPGASRMNFTGREMKGFIIVAQGALDDKALKGWIAMATSYVGALPPKAEKESRRKNA
ncbi:RNA methyltransferase [Mesorhizobium sp. YM1C-6-2]|nr:RNA methyltransferase [Mesorhizobium sp. YM1C-6-2]